MSATVLQWFIKKPRFLLQLTFVTIPPLSAIISYLLSPYVTVKVKLFYKY